MLELIEKYLCAEIRNIILEYLPNDKLMWLTREKYKKYHYSLQPIIETKGMYDNYIRYIIRNDFNIVFEMIMNTHDISSWKMKKYVFRNVKYTNYIHFSESFFCIFSFFYGILFLTLF